jgi:hypothetical protein
MVFLQLVSPCGNKNGSSNFEVNFEPYSCNNPNVILINKILKCQCQKNEITRNIIEGDNFIVVHEFHTNKCKLRNTKNTQRTYEYHQVHVGEPLS